MINTAVGDGVVVEGGSVSAYTGGAKLPEILGTFGVVKSSDIVLYVQKKNVDEFFFLCVMYI